MKNNRFLSLILTVCFILPVFAFPYRSASAQSNKPPYPAETVFSFDSGVGAWSTEMTLHADGTFKGQYVDNDMGDVPPTEYYCSFTGRFSDFQQIDAYTYSMQLAELYYDRSGKVVMEDGIKVISSSPYGIEGGKHFYMYLPGKPLNSLPEGYMDWVRDPIEWTAGSNASVLPFWGIYNSEENCGFYSGTDVITGGVPVSGNASGTQNPYTITEAEALAFYNTNIASINDSWVDFIYLKGTGITGLANGFTGDDTFIEGLIQYTGRMHASDPSFKLSVRYGYDGVASNSAAVKQGIMSSADASILKKHHLDIAYLAYCNLYDLQKVIDRFYGEGRIDTSLWESPADISDGYITETGYLLFTGSDMDNRLTAKHLDSIALNGNEAELCTYFLIDLLNEGGKITDLFGNTPGRTKAVNYESLSSMTGEKLYESIIKKANFKESSLKPVYITLFKDEKGVHFKSVSNRSGSASLPPAYAPEEAARYKNALPEDDMEDFLLQGYYRKYKQDELWRFTKDELDLIRNGQYAMYGKIFKTQKFQRYFESRSWYKPKNGSVEPLNPALYNAILIREYTKKVYGS